MGMFDRERQLCELFESENRAFKINYTINSKEVITYVWHNVDWDNEKGKLILNKLWEKFKLPVVDWENVCKVLNYQDILNNPQISVSKYVFTMRHFSYWKAMCEEFINYDNKYVADVSQRVFKKSCIIDLLY